MDGYASFEDWYHEIEGFALRSERLASPVSELRAAFEAARSCQDVCHKCGSVSGVYLQICDDCLTRFNRSDDRRHDDDEPIDRRPNREGRPEASPVVAMKDEEKEAMNRLVDFWNAYIELPDPDDPETARTVRDAVHAIQGVLAVRVARRANPEIWR